MQILFKVHDHTGRKNWIDPVHTNFRLQKSDRSMFHMKYVLFLVFYRYSIAVSHHCWTFPIKLNKWAVSICSECISQCTLLTHQLDTLTRILDSKKPWCTWAKPIPPPPVVHLNLSAKKHHWTVFSPPLCKRSRFTRCNFPLVRFGASPCVGRGDLFRFVSNVSTRKPSFSMFLSLLET